jgi:hypothetical protein
MRNPILAATLSPIVVGLGQRSTSQGCDLHPHPAHKRRADGRTDRLVTAPDYLPWSTRTLPRSATTSGTTSGSIRPMDERDLLTLESAVTAIEEAASAVAREVERDRLRETSLTRLSTVEAELNRSQLALEKIIQEEVSQRFS